NYMRLSSLFTYFMLNHDPPITTLSPYTTLFRSPRALVEGIIIGAGAALVVGVLRRDRLDVDDALALAEADDDHALRVAAGLADRSEEHTSELQSREKLVCRLLLDKKNHFNRLIQ